MNLPVTLIAEDLLVLLLDDQTGKPQTGHLEIALGGAVLVDLALGGLVEVASHGSLVSSAKPVAVVTAATAAAHSTAVNGG